MTYSAVFVYVCMRHALEFVQLSWNSDIAELNLILIRWSLEMDSRQCNSKNYLHLQIFAGPATYQFTGNIYK